MKIVLLVVSIVLSLNAYEVKFNTTSDFNKLKLNLSDDKIIENIDKNSYSEDEVIDIKNSVLKKDTNKKIISREQIFMMFSQLKTLSKYSMHKEFTKDDLRKRIFKNLLNDYGNFKIPLIFTYKLSYVKEQKAKNRLNYVINNYIMKHYAINFIDAQMIKNNNNFQQIISEKKYGVVEQSSIKEELERKYNEENTKELVGIKKVYFYPFKQISKSSQNRAKKISKSFNSSDMKIDIYDVTNSYKSVEDKFNDKTIEFIDEFIKLQDLNHKYNIKQKDKYKKELSQAKEKYVDMIKIITDATPNCSSFYCINIELKKKFKDDNTQSFDKTYFLEYDIPVNIPFGAAYSAVLYSFVADLKESTQIFYNEKDETYTDDDLDESRVQKNIMIYFKKVEVGVFLKDEKPKVFFKIRLKSQNNNPCSEITTGKEYDRFLEQNFVKYKKQNGDEIGLATTETTIKQFKRFLVTQSDKKKYFSNSKCYGYFKKAKSNYPISCINSKGVIEFFRWLNDVNPDQSTYRLPKCEEWKYIASCGGKLKYCWGDEKKQNNYNENIKCNKKHSKSPMKIASFKKSKSELYDMCGNVSEYCKIKFANKQKTKIIGGNYKTNEKEIEKIGKYKKGKYVGFRILKEY